ncbi:MAG TPA: SGNH/GDSL hydrolase family protein, partial [Desulfobacterales bacterium]|nr:SGNH/GDSL hydrolase family protein [Desulfobacterales bacterium]
MAFRVVALIFSVILATLAIHILGQLTRKPRYIEEQVKFRKNWPGERVHDVVRHRPPNSFYRIRYTDAPHAVRSYPDAPQGYPAADLTLTVDARGYRNLTSFEQYDIVTVGDSFTEGSRVSDDEPWPVLLGKKLNRNVYNLGISGGRPDYYLNVFRAFGLDLRPKIAIFMIYEGNDFKGIRLKKGSTSPEQPLGKRIEEAIKYSPVVMGFKTAFIKYLGPINAGGPVPGVEILSWMPVEVPSGPDAKYYAFRPRRLTRLYWTECEFRQSFGWTSAAKVFKMIKDICDREGIRLVFAYAPSKPHVVMPLAKENISPEYLYAFASLKRRGLPMPKEFKKKLYDRLGSQENVLRE